MSRNKKQEGLGFPFVHSFNLALLAKKWWRLIVQPVIFQINQCWKPHRGTYQALCGLAFSMPNG